MNFYEHQHEFYCGIDLHAKSLHACVIDNKGHKRLHRNFQNAQPDRFLSALATFRKHDLVVACESTFNWYWVADLCADHDIPFILGHALYMKAIHGGKKKNDAIDSEKLSRLVRGGNFPVSFVYPREHRATRDLMRRRTFFMRRRAELLQHVKLVNLQYNLLLLPEISYAKNRLASPFLASARLDNPFAAALTTNFGTIPREPASVISSGPTANRRMKHSI